MFVSKLPNSNVSSHPANQPVPEKTNFLCASSFCRTLERKHEELKAALSFELKLDPVKVSLIFHP